MAQAITDSNGGRPMNRVLLAEAIGYSPSSSGYRDLITASYRYGLIEGNYNSEAISLTVLGTSLTRPRDESERSEALRSAFRHVPIFNQVLNHFANSKLPEPAFLKNTLEREPFSVDPAWSKDVADTFSVDAEQVGFLRKLQGAPYVVLDSSVATPEPVAGPTAVDVREAAAVRPPDEIVGDPPRQPISAPDGGGLATTQLFIAHGKNRKPLEQLQQILTEWQVPFLVAVNEPNAGRPISQKVADIMKSCSAGIFIFTGDEEFMDDEGKPVFRPSQNVIYELGAASLLYGQKIVIFKEDGVVFPSDFSDLGWIEFRKDALDQKAMELLREMIALKAVKLVSTAAG